MNGMKLESKTLQQLLHDMVSEQAIKAEWKQTKVTGLTVDSRKVEKGNCFIAYPGHHSDGRDYLLSAEKAGAGSALVEQDGFQRIEELTIPLVLVPQLQSQLGEIANRFYDTPSQKLKLVAVTGTNGKTSVTQLIAQALQYLGNQSGVIGTLGNGLVGHLNETSNTTPDVIEINRLLFEMVKRGAEFAAMETSSHGLVQGRVDGLCINTALITNISRDHLDYHGTMEAYREAKSLLAKRPGLTNLVLNADDELVISMESLAQPGVYIWSFSQRHQTDVSVCAKDIAFHSSGMEILVEYQGQSAALNSPLVGEFNASNLLAAVTVLLTQGVSLQEACKALSNVQPVEGRMQGLSTNEMLPAVVIDFAHTPDALEKALLALRRHCSGKLWCVFGCGGDRDPGKRPQMAEVVSRLADELVITADNPRGEKLSDIIGQMVKGIPQGTSFQIVEERVRAVEFAICNARAGDVVLLAGKGHEAYQEINGIKHEYSDIAAATAVIEQLKQRGRS